MSTWRPSSDGQGDLPRTAAEGIDRVLRRLGAPPGDQLRAVFERWAEAAGEDIAAHAEPLRLRDGVLVIGVDDGAWAAQLRYLGSDLVRRLEGVVGKGVVTGIEVRVRPR